MAHIVMAHVVMAYMVMASIVIAHAPRDVATNASRRWSHAASSIPSHDFFRAYGSPPATPPTKPTHARYALLDPILWHYGHPSSLGCSGDALVDPILLTRLP